MTLTTDVQILASRGAHYFREHNSLALDTHLFHDLILGTSRKPKDPNLVYADFHAHIHTSTNLVRVIGEAAKRVDILAITGRTADAMFDTHLALGSFCLMAELQNTGKYNIKSLDRLGTHVYVVELNGKPLYLVRATEVYPKEMLGVVAVGGALKRIYYHGKPDLADVVADATDNTALWFFDHPFSMPAPVIAFRYPTEDEVKKRREIFQQYKAMIEVGNHQNTLWLYLANEIAKKVAREDGLVGIANSDTHYRACDIGLSRTGFPRELLDASSEERFLASLRTAFSQKNKDKLVVEDSFASLWSFGNYMIAPTLVPAWGPIAVRYNL